MSLQNLIKTEYTRIAYATGFLLSLLNRTLLLQTHHLFAQREVIRSVVCSLYLLLKGAFVLNTSFFIYFLQVPIQHQLAVQTSSHIQYTPGQMILTGQGFLTVPQDVQVPQGAPQIPQVSKA